MRQVALLGWPVAHSLSPAMHNAAFRAEGIAARYQAVAVEPGQVAPAVAKLRNADWIGANVTIPHKQSVMPHLDRLDPAAELIGAVNTIVNDNGQLRGYNTDWAGFRWHLYAWGLDPAGLQTVILGAGGAARAVGIALAAAGARSVTILNRTAARAEAVLAAVRAAVPVHRRPALAAEDPGGAGARRRLGGADLVVNCTPIGMEPDTAHSPLEQTLGAITAGTWVYDTIYRPMETQLITQATARGLRVSGGLGMLVYQGALAWIPWFGRRGPAAIMWQGAAAALND